MDLETSFRTFVNAVNGHDIEAIAGSLTTDHVFVDSLGLTVKGASAMRAGWASYFAMCPDYWIAIEHVAIDRDVVIAVGEAGGTIDGIPWRTPAAWKASIESGAVKEWRVYADNKPVYDILAKR